MSAEAESVPVPEVAAAAVVELKPKNTHRLNRILRKPKASLAPRKWHPAPVEGESRAVGVPASVVARLLSGLTEEEKQRAAAGLDPLSATQEALIRRAARFGLNVNLINPSAPAPAIQAPIFAIDEETLRRREERFKQGPPAQ